MLVHTNDYAEHFEKLFLKKHFPDFKIISNFPSSHFGSQILFISEKMTDGNSRDERHQIYLLVYLFIIIAIVHIIIIKSGEEILFFNMIKNEILKKNKK